MIIFGSGLFTNDVVNLKHQGACQKLMIGWHKHKGVSETPKNADVICEQPRTDKLPWVCRCAAWRRPRRWWTWWTGTGTASSASPSSGAWWAPTPSCSDVCTSSCSVQTFLNYLSTSNLINIHNSVTKFNGCSCIEATWLCCFNEPITSNAMLSSNTNNY